MPQLDKNFLFNESFLSFNLIWITFILYFFLLGITPLIMRVRNMLEALKSKYFFFCWTRSTACFSRINGPFLLSLKKKKPFPEFLFNYERNTHSVIYSVCNGYWREKIQRRFYKKKND